MNRIYFLLNNLAEFDFQALLEKYLPKATIDIGTTMPVDPADYRLVVLWNVRSIVKDLPRDNNVILFHGSDLPEGRGWAPIYYAFAEQKNRYVLSGVFAASKVDTGDVIVKASFPIPANATASDLRRFDTELSILLVARILERFTSRRIVGKAQQGEGTSRKRRTPEDNRIDVNVTFQLLIPHLRGCEPGWPAFFEFEGVRYTIQIQALHPPAFPSDIDIVFGEDMTTAA
jgi:methionyl-tRNA formyltransferase